MTIVVWTVLIHWMLKKALPDSNTFLYVAIACVR